MGVTLIKQPIYSNFLKTALKLSFDFFQKTSFPNFELPNLGAVFTITVLFLSISMMT